MSIEPATKADQEKMSIGLELAEEDPTLDFPQMRRLGRQLLLVWVNYISKLSVIVYLGIQGRSNCWQTSDCLSPSGPLLRKGWQVR